MVGVFEMRMTRRAAPTATAAAPIADATPRDAGAHGEMAGPPPGVAPYLRVMLGDVAHPDREVRFDMDEPAAAEPRRRECGMLAAERMRSIGHHMPWPAIGFVKGGAMASATFRIAVSSCSEPPARPGTVVRPAVSTSAGRTDAPSAASSTASGAVPASGVLRMMTPPRRCGRRGPARGSWNA
jgi:hypothetical protein